MQKVGVVGAGGRMGQEVCRAVSEAADLELVAAVDPHHGGRPVPEGGHPRLEIAAEVRRIRPTMPVAVISANHQQEIIDRANAVGATFLSKPLTEPALRDFLAGAVRQIRAGAT